jgi:chaperone BCS1
MIMMVMIATMTSIVTTILSLSNHYLIKNVNTGDKIYDTTIIALIGLLTSAIISYVYESCSYNLLNWLLYKLWYRHNNPFDFKTNWYYHPSKEVTINEYAFCNIEKMKEVMEYLNKHSLLKKKTEITKGKNESKSCTINTDQNIVLSRFEPTFPLYYRGKSIVYCIQPHVFSDHSFIVRSKDIESIQDMISYIYLEIHIGNDKEHNTSDRHIYEYKNGSESKLGLISKQKTFDKLHFDDKSFVINTIEKFSKGELYPSAVSMDNKLGILLYGPPGTGKTGTILAIANYLKRDVLMINFSSVKKKSDLFKILNPNTFKDKIFVFDEFDCILDVLTDRKEPIEEKQSEMDWSKVLAVSNEIDRKEILQMMRDTLTQKQENEDIDMAYLLSTLDGLEDHRDRVIIATTNHPEKINPVLLRPGRFDLKLCLGNCSKQMYKDILSSYFHDVIPTILEHEVEQLKEKKWSPLEVYNQCLITNDFYKTIRNLA